MALNFQGTDITPKRGVNLTGRKTSGVRLSILKKGQKSITIGFDVLEQLAITDLGEGIKVKVALGTGAAWGGKIMVQPAEDGPFTLRYVSAKKKNAGHIMSSSLPFDVSAKAPFKVYADDKALVIKIPAASEAAPADGAAADGEGAAAGTDGAAAGAEGDADFS